MCCVRGSVAATNVVDVSTRLSNGITINEPDTAAVMGGSCRDRFRCVWMLLGRERGR